MVKTKITPQMIRQLQRASSEEKLPKKESQENNFIGNQSGNENFDYNQEEDLQQLKIKKEAFAKKRIEEIEQEMKVLAQKRQEEMRKRREEIFEQQQNKESEEKKAQVVLVSEISSKPKRGAPFWGKRIKTAQQQSQPETAGRRVGG